MVHARARTGRVIGVAVVASAIAATAAVGPVDAVSSPTRLAGGDPAETAALVSRAGWPSSADAVVVATTGWTDALAATALGLPILLVDGDVVPAATTEELRRLGVRRIWVVGGIRAIGRAARDRLRGDGAALTEVAGTDRYDTAARLARAAALTVSGEVVVASGEAWADAASIGAWAASTRTPIYLTTRDRLPPASGAARDASRTVVVGGTGAISDAVVAELPRPTRLHGADRYGTNVAVARWAAGRGLGFDRPVLGPGESPIEALLAGTLAARRASAVVLTPPGRLPVGTQQLLVKRATTVSSVAVVGAAVQVGDAAVADATAALEAADLVTWVNGFRTSNGRGALVRDDEQTDRALTHATALAEQGRLFHQSPQCSTWGENVGTAGDARTVFDMWTVHSSHRSVLLMGSVTRAGTAVVTGGDGRRWVVLDVCA